MGQFIYVYIYIKRRFGISLSKIIYLSNISQTVGLLWHEAEAWSRLFVGGSICISTEVDCSSLYQGWYIG